MPEQRPLGRLLSNFGKAAWPHRADVARLDWIILLLSLIVVLLAVIAWEVG